jgi:hypothetical protein
VPLISENQVQSAFDYLEGECESAAQAKADVLLAEYRVKSTRGRLILNAPKVLGTAALRQAWAESHEDYIKAYEEEAVATKQWELHNRMKVWAESTRDAWRTEQSNTRALGKF